MIFSKKLLLGLMLSSLTITTACFQPKNKATDENSATFIVEDVTGDGVVTKTTPDWELPSEKLFNFKVCTKHLITREAIQGHKFQIIDTKGNIIPQTSGRSGNDGCFTWAETVKYDFIADVKYIPLTRYIRADGIHTGQKRLDIAINPWSKDKTSPQVVDRSRQKISPNQIVSEEEGSILLKAEDKKSKGKIRKLWVDGMIINISSQGITDSKSNATIKLDIAPRLLLADLNGNPEVVTINKGKFRAKVYLVSVIREGNNIKKTRLGTGISLEPQTMVGDRVRFDIPLSLAYKSSMGQLEMALVLEPDGGPANLAAFESVFFIGSYKTQMGFIGHSVKNDAQKFDRTFSVEDYMKKSVSEPNPLDLPNGVFAVQPFEFDPIEFLFGQVKIEKETPTSRTISILMQTVVRNPMENNEPVRSAEFTITLWDGSKINKRSLPNGTIAWRDKITYPTYSPPHYLLKNVTFLNEASKFSETIPVRLNPWALFGYALGYDVRRPDAESEEELLKDSTNLIPSQMYMGKFVMAINQNIYYKVQKGLNVDPYKSFIINLAPKILNYSHPINGIESSHPFRDGSYLLKMALVTRFGKEKIISTVKKIVKVREGQINEDIRLRIPDLRQARVKSDVYVEIHPIDYGKLTPFLLAVKGQSDTEHSFVSDDPEITEKLQASFPNLDDLIEKNTGIETRTFVITSFTPFANKAEGPLRPTDDLDERIKKDPGILKELYENGLKIFKTSGDATRFFSRMKFKSHNEITVSDIEKEEIAQNKRESETYAKNIDLAQFVDHSNADFITLKNEAEILEKNPTLKNNNILLKSENGVQNLLTSLNKYNNFLGQDHKDYKAMDPNNSPATEKDLRALLAADAPMPGGKTNKVLVEKSVSKIMAARLCDLWLSKTLKPLNLKDSVGLAKRCLKDIASRASTDEIFTLDQKIRVHEFEQAGDLLSGYFLRLGFNSDFRVSYGFSKGESQSGSFSFSPLNIVNAFKGVLNFFTSFVGLNLAVHQESQGYDFGEGKGNGLNVSTSISGEEGKLVLKLNKYEKCSVVRMNPDYVRELFLADNMKVDSNEKALSSNPSRMASGKITVLKPEADMVQDLEFEKKADLYLSRLTDSQIKTISRGIMVCSGEVETTPLFVPETVYYFTSDPQDGNMLEPYDFRNYPWTVSFRGKRDYSQFISVLKAQGIDKAKKYDDLTNTITRNQSGDANQKPIQHIDHSFSELKRNNGGVITTYPGVYTVP